MVGPDALGRKVSENKDAETNARIYCHVLLTWQQGDDDTTTTVKNITEIVRKYPEAMKNYDHPAWGKAKPGLLFLEKPLLGYYKTTDPWVLRKHAEMLADAKVDVVFFDCTNGSITWIDYYEALLKTWDQAQKEGVNVPKIAFMLPFGYSVNSLTSLRQLYKDVYKPGRYENLVHLERQASELWHSDNLTETVKTRRLRISRSGPATDYVNGPPETISGMLENILRCYVKNGMGTLRSSVGVAQNASSRRQGHCSAF